MIGKLVDSLENVDNKHDLPLGRDDKVGEVCIKQITHPLSYIVQVGNGTRVGFTEGITGVICVQVQPEVEQFKHILSPMVSSRKWKGLTHKDLINANGLERHDELSF